MEPHTFLTQSMSANSELYDLFISHKQSNGGPLAMNIKLLLKEKDPSLNIFLDVDDLHQIHDLEDNVKNSRNFLLLLTEGVLERPFVLTEIRMALQAKKNIILVWDKDRCEFPNKDTVAEDIQEVLLLKAVKWDPEKEYREVALQKILEVMVTRTSAASAQNSKTLTTDVEFSDSFMLPVLESYEIKSEGHISKHVAQTLHSIFTSLISHSKVQNNAALYFNEQWELWQSEHSDRAISDSKKMFLSHIKKTLFSNEEKVIDFILESEHKHGEVSDIFKGVLTYYLNGWFINTKVIENFVDDAFGGISKKGTLRKLVTSELSRKFLPIWGAFCISAGITSYCIVKDVYSQYLSNFITFGKLFVSNIPNPDYYGRLSESLFAISNHPGFTEKNQRELMKNTLKHEFGDGLTHHDEFHAKFHSLRQPHNIHRYLPAMKQLAEGIFLLSIEMGNSRKTQNIDFDIILLSNPKSSYLTAWQAADDSHTFWPKHWLTRDFPNARVLLMTYEVDWKYNEVIGPLERAATNLAEKLRKVNFGERPCCFVAHSSGGLIVKQILISSRLRKSSQQLADNTKLVVFYGCPNKGSKAADYSHFLQHAPEVEIAAKDIDMESKHLQWNNRLFEAIETTTMSFGELQKTSKTLSSHFVVERNSLFDFYLDVDHSHLIKPKSEEDTGYVQLVKKINETLKSK